MKIIETKVYTFDELNDEAKEKARDWYRESALDYEWWDSVYEDASTTGLRITGFDLDRNRHATGEFIKDAQDVAARTIALHGIGTPTHNTAIEFINEPVKNDETESEFLQSLLEDYSIMLQNESEYLTSDEAVDEALQANEYTFTEDGKHFA